MNNILAGADGLTVLPFRMKAMQMKLRDIGFSSAAIQPYFIRAFVPLESGKTSYPISFSKKDNTDNTTDKTQRFIPNNDVFAPVGLKVGVKKITTASSNYGSRIYTYADKGVFDGTGENAAIDGIFTGGVLDIKADNQEIIYSLPISELEYVPRVQVAATTHPSSGNKAELESYTLINKEFLLMGQNDNVANISLIQTSTAAIIAGDTGEQNYVGILMCGLIVRNGGAAVLNLDLAAGDDTKYVML